MLRTHTCGQLRLNDEKERVTLCGWVHSIRYHGNVTFIDLRDRYGKTQIVVKGKHELKLEYVVCISGEVKERKKGQKIRS